MSWLPLFPSAIFSVAGFCVKISFATFLHFLRIRPGHFHSDICAQYDNTHKCFYLFHLRVRVPTKVWIFLQGILFQIIKRNNNTKMHYTKWLPYTFPYHFSFLTTVNKIVFFYWTYPQYFGWNSGPPALFPGCCWVPCPSPGGCRWAGRPYPPLRVLYGSDGLRHRSSAGFLSQGPRHLWWMWSVWNHTGTFNEFWLKIWVKGEGFIHGPVSAYWGGASVPL